MKPIFVLSPHSFVDLITNSSSEVFVCSGEKQREAAIRILEKLLACHNELSGASLAFNEVFGEIKAIKYSFCYSSLPYDLTDRYEEFHYSPSDYSGPSYMDTPRYKKLMTLQRALEKEIGVNEKGLYESNIEEYNSRRAIFREKSDELWADWRKDGVKAKLALFEQFCLINSIPVPDFKSALEAKNSWHLWGENPPEGWEDFKFVLGWGIDVKNGDLLVYSNGDNSIPFEMLDTIESYLGARRYHLG